MNGDGELAAALERVHEADVTAFLHVEAFAGALLLTGAIATTLLLRRGAWANATALALASVAATTLLLSSPVGRRAADELRQHAAACDEVARAASLAGRIPAPWLERARSECGHRPVDAAAARRPLPA